MTVTKMLLGAFAAASLMTNSQDVSAQSKSDKIDLSKYDLKFASTTGAYVSSVRDSGTSLKISINNINGKPGNTASVLLVDKDGNREFDVNTEAQNITYDFTTNDASTVIKTPDGLSGAQLSDFLDKFKGIAAQVSEEFDKNLSTQEESKEQFLFFSGGKGHFVPRFKQPAGTVAEKAKGFGLSN